jgi:hypothetical protein
MRRSGEPAKRRKKQPGLVDWCFFARALIYKNKPIKDKLQRMVGFLSAPIRSVAVSPD